MEIALQIQALQGPGVSDELYEIVCTFNKRLLSDDTGKLTLVDNLVKRIKDTALEPQADSKVVDTVNARGHLANRHALLQAERGVLSKVSVFPRSSYTCRIV